MLQNLCYEGSRKQIIGLTPGELSPATQPNGKPSAEIIARKIEELTRLGRSRFDWLHKRLDGSDFWVDVSATIAAYEGRSVMLVSWREISDRKQAELKLRQSEERFRAIIHASPVPIILVDSGEHILFFTPAFTRVFGYGLDDFRTLPDWWLKACPDMEYRTKIQRNWHELNAQEKNESKIKALEIHIQCKDGTTRIVQAEETRLPGSAAEQQILITLFDITPLRSVTNHLKALLDNASDGIHILDHKGNIVEFSQSFARMLGYTPKETARLNVTDWELTIVPGEQEKTIEQIIGEQTTFETKHKRSVSRMQC